jgi:hypothetical protein
MSSTKKRRLRVNTQNETFKGNDSTERYLEKLVRDGEASKVTIPLSRSGNSLFLGYTTYQISETSINVTSTPLLHSFDLPIDRYYTITGKNPYQRKEFANLLKRHTVPQGS